MGQIAATMKAPPDPWAVTAQAHACYASLLTDATVSYDDGTTDTLPAHITAAGLGSVNVHPLYVVYLGATAASVVRTDTGAIVSSLALSGGDVANAAIALNPGTGRVYWTGDPSGLLYVFDSDTGSLITTVATGAGATPAAVDTSTNTIFAASSLHTILYIVDGATNTLTATVTPPDTGGAICLGVNPTTGTIYLPDSTTHVYVIDEATATVTATIGVGNVPGSMAVNTTTNMVYVGNITDGTISVIDGSTNTVTSTYSPGVSSGPNSLVLDEGANVLYGDDQSTGHVVVIDASTNTVLTTIDTGAVSYLYLALDVTSQTLYAANPNINTISVIDTLSHTVRATWLLPAGALGPVTYSSREIVVGGGPAAMDRTTDAWVLYTLKGSGVLSVVKESALGSVFGDYAYLARVVVNDILPPPGVTSGTTHGNAYRRGLVVTAADLVGGSTSDATPASTDYVVNFVLTGTDAATVFGQLQYADGSDLSVYDTAGGMTSLDVDVATCSSSRIDLWFKLRRPIGTSGTDTNYALAWGNGSPTPLRTWDHIYPLADDFVGSTLDTSKWTQNKSASGIYPTLGGSTLTFAGGQPAGENSSITSVETFAAAYMVTMRGQMYLGTNGANDEATLGFGPAGPSYYVPGVNLTAYTTHTNYILNIYDTAPDQFTTGTAFTSASHLFSVARDTSGNGYGVIDGTATNTGGSGHASTSSQPISVFAEATGTLTTDAIKVRPWTLHEPSVVFA